MSNTSVKILMIGPGSTEISSGGVVTVIESLINNIDPTINVKKIVTMRPVGIVKRLLIYMCALKLIFSSILMSKEYIAHIHMASNGSFYRKAVIIILLKIFKVPIMIHIHGSEFDKFYANKLNKPMKKYLKWIFSLADLTVLLSKSWRKWYLSNVNTNKSIVIYNGVEDYYKEGILPLPERKNMIVFLGRLGQRKGTYDLLYAFKNVLSEIPDAILKIGGDGELKECKALVKSLNIEDSVDFLGWVGEEDKCKLLNEAKMYILPSYNEGLPMGILEAMSAGIPVVSTTVGGIPEAITHEVDGLIIEPGDRNMIAKSVIALLDNTYNIAEMGCRARERYLKDFNIVEITKRFENEYYELVK